MWNDVYFDAFGDIFFQYKYEGDLFFVRCEIYLPQSESAKVWAQTEKGPILLGSLKSEKGFLILEKTYPTSFLVSDESCKLSFYVEFENGYKIKSHTKDRAIENANEILHSLKEYTDIEIQPILDSIDKKLIGYKKETPAFMQEFEWYAIDNENETFNLTSVEHIVRSKGFADSFKKSGKWLFGKGNENIFAICTQKSGDGIHPMENALDCLSTQITEDGTHYIVGIGLFRDGQYFLRL